MTCDLRAAGIRSHLTSRFHTLNARSKPRSLVVASTESVVNPLHPSVVGRADLYFARIYNMYKGESERQASRLVW